MQQKLTYEGKELLEKGVTYCNTEKVQPEKKYIVTNPYELKIDCFTISIFNIDNHKN